jgi:cell division protein FtsI/penicillin-binding protein 2/cell division protein FtsW (lipid II flippase)
MAVTKSWEQSRAIEKRSAPPAPRERKLEAWWLLASTTLVACGLALVYFAKTQDFPAQQARLERGELLNLNAAAGADSVIPFLALYSDSAERQAAAESIASYLETHRPLLNTGALARIRLTKAEIENDSRWNVLRKELRQRLAQQKDQKHEVRVPLVPLSRLKAVMIVRTPAEYRGEYVRWCLVALAAFWMVHLSWRWRKFRGDPGILPALQLLSGMGLILAVSLRDPLRDTVEFRKSAWGIALGCCLLLLPLLRAFHYHHFAGWVYTPLLASLALFGLLIVFGSGPSGSDAKVNLGPFQPVEVIKVLVVLFMAGYFAQKWEWLRHLRERKLLPPGFRWIALPRVALALPVMVGVTGALAMFFLLKDMGPALVVGILFLTMFAVARNRPGLALLGAALLVGGVAIGYRQGAPHTVVERVSMWLSPWDNDVHGGDQIAHSLWAFATGGVFGSGPGWGDPSMIPAGHTDLVLPAIGEEWGFCGVVAILLLFVFLVHKAFQIALRASDEYGMFLSLGMGSLIALEMLLISGGVLAAIPLSGVVSPFLSTGNTAMLANFLVFAFLLSVSNGSTRATDATPPLVPMFGPAVRIAGLTLLVMALALAGKAAWYQVFHDQDLIARDALVFAEDGVKRPQHNPRLNSLAREIRRGSVYDRNGVLLATSDWDELERSRPALEKLGVSIEQTCSRVDSRHYPFGAATVHLLGDLRTGDNFHATNSSLIEHDSNRQLQGYTDLHELGRLVRYRHQPLNPEIQALLRKDRTVRASIDIRLQLRANELLRTNLEATGKRGALVMMNAQTGEVLALASYPSPVRGENATPDQLLDRARYGEYPPGSTFKLVTAMAALRLNPRSKDKVYSCRRLPDGRVGTVVPGWRRPIRDDIGDNAHGALNMERAITVSCNAYFAQLGVFDVGSKALSETAGLLDLPAGPVNEIQKMLPFASYGQGPVLVTPFKMARVAATIANDGAMPQGRWVIDSSNARKDVPRTILPAEQARFLSGAMRSVVTGGTGRSTMAGLNVSVAGKTGTAQVGEGDPHSWFAGFAPYSAEPSKRFAFAVVVEHGGYGAQFAAPIARQMVEAARDDGILTADLNVPPVVTKR